MEDTIYKITPIFIYQPS